MTGRIDAADLDGDGDLDIVLTEEETCPEPTLTSLFSEMTETRTSFECPISSLPVYCLTALALADVTGDGNDRHY